MSSPDISVVICVYTEDRWEQICAAVQSLRVQSLPCAEIIMVVDYTPGLYERLSFELGRSPISSKWRIHTGSAGIAGQVERRCGAWLGGTGKSRSGR